MVRGAIQALKSCLWHEVVGQGISTLTQVAWLSVGARGGGDCLVNAWQPMTRAYGTFTTSGTTGERSNILVGLAYPPSATVAWLGTDPLSTGNSRKNPLTFTRKGHRAEIDCRNTAHRER